MKKFFDRFSDCLNEFLKIPSCRFVALLFLASLFVSTLSYSPNGLLNFFEILGISFVIELLLFFPFSRDVLYLFSLFFFMVSLVFFVVFLYLLSLFGGA